MLRSRSRSPEAGSTRPAWQAAEDRMAFDTVEPRGVEPTTISLGASQRIAAVTPQFQET